MRYGNYEKLKRIQETEEVIKSIQRGITASCSNEECNNKLTLTEEEINRNIMCTKCYSGFFVKPKTSKGRKNVRSNNNKKNTKTKNC